jgi:thiol-disulfide isomerase/thioredoxin
MKSAVMVKMSTQDRSSIIKAKAQKYPSAIEIIPGAGPGSNGFINSQPFTLKSLIGKKVILLDFWTYSCINCQRTIPYLNAWYDKYKDKGLVIVGVHTPEFDFEKDYNNVLNGVKSLGIEYPVVQDNNMATWSAYQNEYWPHEYLIDIDGFIVHDKIGEGSYDETEMAIQKALMEREQVLGMQNNISTSIANPSNVITVDSSKPLSPETYFGSNRNNYFANGQSGLAGIQNLTEPLPSAINADAFYLDGSWNFTPELAENTSAGAKIIYKYSAKNVYFVASSKNPNEGVKIKVLRDGILLTGNERGEDVASDGTVTIKENRLYKIVKGSDYGEHTLEIDVMDSGMKSRLDAYTFTFG